MFGSRRPGKRSIVGTRVCAPYEGGFYRPGVIRSIKAGYPLPTYDVQFDEGGSGIFIETDLIGSGFQSLTPGCLKVGQTVYITHNGREVKGCLMSKDSSERHVNGESQRVWLVGFGTDEKSTTLVKLDDIRLIESRKSARLVDQDTDYIKLADLPNGECKKRTVTNCIDVPSAKHSKGNYTFDKDDMESSDVFMQHTNCRDIEMEVMDEHMAAMALTSLSCSPVSPAFLANMNDQTHQASPIGSYYTNGAWNGMASAQSPPKLLLSQSAPAKVDMFTFMNMDEGKHDTNEHIKMSKRTVYQCTWPGCKTIYYTCPGIEKHIRIEHLCSKEGSDHEEEFYYSEMEVTLDAALVDVCTSSSPPSQSTCQPNLSSPLVQPPPVDHDYQRKESILWHRCAEFRSPPVSIPLSKSSHSCVDHSVHYGGHSLSPGGNSCTIPVPSSMHSNEQQLSSSLPWQLLDQQSPTYENHDSSFSYTNCVSPGSKMSSSSKKSRMDVKKCRKIYGLENRASWCTQCKWKKACTRFQERGGEVI